MTFSIVVASLLFVILSMVIFVGISYPLWKERHLPPCFKSTFDPFVVFIWFLVWFICGTYLFG